SRESVDFMHSVLTPQLSTGPTQEATLASPDGMVSGSSAESVYLVQLATPIRVGKLEITEFLECLKLANHGTDIFALRVDGDSMHPALSHGDFIIVSPSESVQAGRAAVVQLRNQIGVTCKLFYKDKGLVRLIPINEQFQPTKHPAGELVWALPVLYRVRLRGV
ncbi:MAG: S24 family peptidase, partial [Planctomycetes bacterium]|nr:S24 family peptidase [Planctomycetota bacterium]